MNPKSEQGGCSQIFTFMLKFYFYIVIFNFDAQSVLLFCVPGSMASKSRQKSCGRNIMSFWKSTRFAMTKWTNRQLRESTLPVLPFGGRLNVRTILGLFKILLLCMSSDIRTWLITGLMKLKSFRWTRFFLKVFMVLRMWRDDMDTNASSNRLAGWWQQTLNSQCCWSESRIPKTNPPWRKGAVWPWMCVKIAVFL